MKLVRDKYPAIVTAKGEAFDYRIASANERHELLRDKLFEEVCEYLDGEDPLELADILEVISALAGEKGMSLEGVILLAKKKREEKGGFERGVVWLGENK